MSSAGNDSNISHNNISYSDLEILEYAGHGDSGVTYEGEWLGEPVMIKFLGRGDSSAEPRAKPPNSLLDDSLKSHSNVARVIGFSLNEDTEPAQHIVITEKIQGAVSLAQFVSERCRRSVFFDAFNLMLQISKGLEFLHSKGVLHKALKPSNILIHHSSSGELSVKLVDFGLGNSYWDLDPDAAGADSKHYMAPEVLNCVPSDYDSLYTMGCDVFSFSLLCETHFLIPLVTGDLHRRISMPEIFDCLAQLHYDPKSLSELLSLLLRSREDDPSLRPSASEIRGALSCLENGGQHQLIQDITLLLNERSKPILLLQMLESMKNVLNQLGQTRVLDKDLDVTVYAALKHCQKADQDLDIVIVQVREALWMLILFLVKSTFRKMGETEKRLLELMLDHDKQVEHRLSVYNPAASRKSTHGNTMKLMDFVESRALFTHERTWLMLQLAYAMFYLHQDGWIGYLQPNIVHVNPETMSLRIEQRSFMKVNSPDRDPRFTMAQRDVRTFGVITYKILTGAQPAAGELNLDLLDCCGEHQELVQLIKNCVTATSSQDELSFESIHPTISSIRACLALNWYAPPSQEELVDLEAKSKRVTRVGFTYGYPKFAIWRTVQTNSVQSTPWGWILKNLLRLLVMVCRLK